MNHAISAGSTEPKAPVESIPQYTARNSGRFQSEQGKAAKYLPGKAPVPRLDDRQAQIRKAAALRHAYRLERDWQVSQGGDPYRIGLQSILYYLFGVREAENLNALVDRDRQLCGMINGAHAFQAITIGDAHTLGALRSNAFNLRHAELMKCLPHQ